MKEFFAELNQMPEWQAIVKQIKKDFPSYYYNPNDPKKSAQDQEDQWKFVSGRKKEYDRICQILNIEV